MMHVLSRQLLRCHALCHATAAARKVVASILLASVFAQPSAHAGEVLDRIRDKGVVVLAHREASVPFSYMGELGKPTGYALAFCHALVDAIQKQKGMPPLKVEYVMVTPADRIEAIEEGRADLECGSTTNNAERRKRVAFTVPHYITGARFLVRADSGIEQIRDFRGKRLVSTKGTTPMKALARVNRQFHLDATLLEAPEHAAAVEMVAKGEAEGFAMDDVLLYGLLSGRPDAKDMRVVGKFLGIEPLAIMLSKNDPEFKALLDAEMKRLIRSREAYVIYEQWFQRPIPPSGSSLELPMNYLLLDFWKYPTDIVPG